MPAFVSDAPSEPISASCSTRSSAWLAISMSSSEFGRSSRSAARMTSRLWTADSMDLSWLDRTRDKPDALAMSRRTRESSTAICWRRSASSLLTASCLSVSARDRIASSCPFAGSSSARKRSLAARSRWILRSSLSSPDHHRRSQDLAFLGGFSGGILPPHSTQKNCDAFFAFVLHHGHSRFIVFLLLSLSSRPHHHRLTPALWSRGLDDYHLPPDAASDSFECR